MTERERALVEAHDAENGKEQAPYAPRPPEFTAGWFVKTSGSAEDALARWQQTGGKLHYDTEETRSWAEQVTRLLQEAATEAEERA